MYESGAGTMTDRQQDLRTALKERGLRMTPQRQLILQAVETAEGHFTADGIHRRVSDQFPEVNATTVYRTLEVLEQLGFVQHTHFHDGVAYYHRADEALHHHLVCSRCGAETELDVSVLSPLAAKLRRDHDFDADLGHFAIVGTCGSCRAAS